MDKRLVSILLLAAVTSGMVFSGCDKKVSPDGETTLRTPAEAANTPTTTPSPSPTSTPTPTPSPTPVIITETTYLYDEFVVHTDWSNYTPYTATAPESVYTRLRDDYIEEFYPADEYGYVFPFLGMETDNDLYSEEHDQLYGLCDINGRIVCDPVFYDVFEREEFDLYITTTITSDTGTRKYGILKRDGTFYSGQIYDDYTYDNDQLIMIKRLSDHLLVTTYGAGCETKIPECEFRIDFSALNQVEYVDYDYSDYQLFIGNVLPDGHARLNVYYTGQLVIFDYRTGEILNPANYNMYNASGNVYFAGNNASDNSWQILSSSGEPLTSEVYESLADLGDGTYLVHEQDADQSYIIDSTGNVVREIPGRTLYADGSFYSYQDRHIVVYDRSFNETGTLETDLRNYYPLDYYFMTYDHGITYTEDGYHLFYDRTRIYDPAAGIRVDKPQSGSRVSPFGDGILVYSWNDSRAWSAYDGNLMLLDSGSGLDRFCTDVATGIPYVLNGAHDVIDVDSCTTVLQLDVSGARVRDFTVHDGIIHYTTDQGTFMVTLQGETIFHYNPTIWDQYA